MRTNITPNSKHELSQLYEKLMLELPTDRRKSNLLYRSKKQLSETLVDVQAAIKRGWKTYFGDNIFLWELQIKNELEVIENKLKKYPNLVRNEKKGK